VQFDILHRSYTSEYVFKTRDFNSVDWSQVKSFLDRYDFFDLFHSGLPPAIIITEFYKIINACLDQFAPIKRTAITNKPHLALYPQFIRRRLRRKATAWRIYRAFKTPESLNSYKKLASQCKSDIYSFALSREKHLVEKGNIGKFFRYANSKFSSKSTIGPLLRSDGSLTSDSLAKASIFQNTFVQNFTSDNCRLPKETNFKHPSSQLSHIIFSPSLIRRAIRRLKVKTSPGPDGIPTAFFINCIDELCYPLSLLFTLSFESGILPASWLISYITPIFKKGNPADANNYRPIALTSVMCKLMETIIKDQIARFLLDKAIINKSQHAFIKNHSTASNLLASLHDWSIGLNSHLYTDIVYTNFSKAFDSIVPSKLLLKLELYGICGQLLNWIKHFLTNREQYVVIDRFYSSAASVVSGVPQGSVLGPILFIIYINDIGTVCSGEAKLQLFADDAKLYSNVTLNSTVSLQQSLDRLAQWATEWQLTINISKCCVLTISPANHSRSSAYNINGVAVPQRNDYVDLGVTISGNLSFDTHINNIVSKARLRVSTLFRGFVTRNLYVMRRAFTTYVRPILEYNSVVWNPSLIHQIETLENVQRQFSKRIPQLSALTYLERLALLDLEPLEMRRLKLDLIYYFKILNRLTAFNPNDVFLIYTPSVSSRSNTPYLQKPIKTTNKHLNHLFYRQVDVWNALPNSIRLASSLPVFKYELNKFDFSNFMKGKLT
jgi:hypothetical protein